MRLLTEVEGVVVAAPDVVADALRLRLLERTAGEGAARLEIDAPHRRYAVEGGWWYRGEYSVVSAGPGRSSITLRVFDVAQRLAWGVALANRGFVGFAARTREDFETLLAELAEDVQARASTMGRNLTRVSSSSASGSLPATIPAPAWATTGIVSE